MADSAQDQELLARARRALENAHAPYSAFRVGAAVIGDDGHTYVGVNVENASYGLTVCAERVAVFTAIANGARRIARIALSTESAPGETSEAMPCGACRQVLAEFMSPDATVIVDHVGSFSLRELLPLAFVLTK